MLEDLFICPWPAGKEDSLLPWRKGAYSRDGSLVIRKPVTYFFGFVVT